MIMISEVINKMVETPDHEEDAYSELNEEDVDHKELENKIVPIEQ